MCNIVITTEEIVDIIKIINPNKASGPDIISHKMLKICPEKIAAPLQIFLVNLKCSYTFLIVGVLLNILGVNQIDIHKLTCFFVDG
jgi:hypothetical protein